MRDTGLGSGSGLMNDAINSAADYYTGGAASAMGMGAGGSGSSAMMPQQTTVSPTTQTTVSPQISPVFQQQFQPQNSGLTANTTQTAPNVQSSTNTPPSIPGSSYTPTPAAPSYPLSPLSAPSPTPTTSPGAQGQSGAGFFTTYKTPLLIGGGLLAIALFMGSPRAVKTSRKVLA